MVCLRLVFLTVVVPQHVQHHHRWILERRRVRNRRDVRRVRRELRARDRQTPDHERLGHSRVFVFVQLLKVRTRLHVDEGLTRRVLDDSHPNPMWCIAEKLFVDLREKDHPRRWP